MGWNTWLRFKMKATLRVIESSDRLLIGCQSPASRSLIASQPPPCPLNLPHNWRPPQAIFEWSVLAPYAELKPVRWHVYVDDDTCALIGVETAHDCPRWPLMIAIDCDLLRYVLAAPLIDRLRQFDPDVPHYFGRPLQEVGRQLMTADGI